MAFFRKWKNYTKHKKLSEEFGALAAAAATTTTTNSKKYNNPKSINRCAIFEELDDQAIADDVDGDPESFNSQYIVKYLGSTLIQSAKSEEATATAVKSIITKCKGNAGKKLQKVSLSISPKGIDASDILTTECILQISIYKISYCSADATHSNVFAFIASENLSCNSTSPSLSSPSTISPLSSTSSSIIVADDQQQQYDEELQKDENLICYAFLCNKRKIAQNITLTVARSFECAYQIWRDHNVINTQKNNNYNNKKRKSSNEITEKTKNTIKPISNNNNNNISNQSSITIESNNLLIDFNNNNGRCNSSSSSESSTSSPEPSFELPSNNNNVLLLYNKDQRSLLQNTWVSFDDQQQHHNFSDNFPNEEKKNNFDFTTNSYDNTNRNQQSATAEHIWSKNIVCL